MPPRLALAVDKSQAFISFHREKTLEAWGVEPMDLKPIRNLAQANGSATLFGEELSSLLTLETADELKRFLSDVEKSEAEGTLNSKLAPGLFVQTSLPRTSTKTLEKVMAKLGSELFISKNTEGTPTEKLLGLLNLNRAAQSFLVSYLGEDYESALPLVKSISKLPTAHQFKITEEDLFIRLPQPPGALPPWTLENPLLKGNMTEVIDVFRRVAKHSSLLVVLAILKNKFSLMFKVAALLETNPRVTTKELSVQLEVPDNYPLKLALGNAKKHGLPKVQASIECIAKAEAKVKGGSSASSMVEMEVMLVELALILVN